MNIKLIILCLSFCLPLQAGDGHDHSHGGHSHDVVAEKAPAETIQKVEATTARLEAVLKYKALNVGDTTIFRLYLSDSENNQPLLVAGLKVGCMRFAQQKFNINALDSGIYEIKTLFAAAEDHVLLVEVPNANGEPDKIVLPTLHVGHSHDEEHHEAEEEHLHAWYLSAPFMFGSGLALGLLLMLLLRKKQPRSNAIILLLIFNAALLNAGDGHDHDHSPAPAKANTGLLEFEIPKETQFLLGIRTRTLRTSDFQPTTVLFANTTAAPGGLAEITAPYYGKLTQIYTKPGEQVRAGQRLATMEQTISTTDNVNMTTQAGQIQVELSRAKQQLAAAQKERERLKNIQDIAAQKDLQRAEATYNQALAELERWQTLAETDLPPKRNTSVSIVSPIDGVVDVFHLTAGSSVTLGEPLFTVANTKRILAEVQVPDKDLAAFKEARQFQVISSHASQKMASAKLLSLVPSVHNYNQTQKALLEVDNSDLAFRMGEFVQVQVFHPFSKAALAVPVSAMGILEGQAITFVKIGAEKFVLRYVRTGDENGQSVSIEKGIKEGEKMIVSGAYLVKMIFLNR